MPVPEFLQDADLSDLPQEYLDSPLVQEAKGMTGIIKQAVDYQRLSGEQIRVPGPDSPADEWDKMTAKLTTRGVFDNESVLKAVNTKRGVVSEADKFELKVETLPEGVTLDDAKLDKWKKTFAESGMTNDQANKMLNAYGAVISEELASTAEAAGKRDELLKTEFGQAYETTMAQVFNAANEFGGEDAVAAVKASDPAVVKLMASIAKKFQFNGDGQFTAQGDKAGLSPAEASARWAEIQPMLENRAIPAKERQRLLRESLDLQDQMNGRKPQQAA